MSGLFSSPPPPPVVIPPAPLPTPRMPDIGSPVAKEAAIKDVTNSLGMGREGTDLTKKRNQSLGGNNQQQAQSSAPVASDTFSRSKLG